MRVVKELKVKTGEYTNRDGESKGRYLQIGVIMDGGDRQFMLLEKTFNPAGVEGKDGKIVVSMFDPQPKEKRQGYIDDSGKVQTQPIDDEIPW